MPKLMQKVAEGIAPSVTNLYNKCIETIVTGQLYARKRGELTPVSKKGDKHNVEIMDLSLRFPLTRFLNHCLANK